MMYNKKLFNNRGSVIIVGLLALTLLSLLGLASTNKSQTDINIASNSKDIELSLYASETALVVGETSINELDAYSQLNEEEIAGHHCVGNKRLEDYEVIDNDELNWTDNDALEVSSEEMPQSWRENISDIPKYSIICEEFVPDCDTLSNDCANTGINIYKVVARGKGNSVKTVMTLESLYHWRHR